MEKKVYKSRREKVIDFLVGFIAIPFFLYFPILVRIFPRPGYYYPRGLIFGSVFVWFLFLALSAYIGFKRKFIGIGLLFSLIVVPLVALGTCFLFGGR